MEEIRTATLQTEKGETTFYKALHRYIMIYQHKPHTQKPGVNTCVP